MDLDRLKGFLGLTRMEWEMTPSERLVVVALLELLRPRTALELGHRFGGCTAWLSHYCQEVVTVDIDPSVIPSSERFPNVTPLHMTTAEAIARLQREGRTFDLVFVDADHSFASASRDLSSVLPMAQIVLLHDTSNPTCRAGYREALRNHTGYYDLDLVEGHVQIDGLWGGIGIVTTMIPGSTPSLITPRELTFDLLEKRWLEKIGQEASLPAPPAPTPGASRSPGRPALRWVKKVVGMLNHSSS
jgi:hypothetical protein